MIDKIFYDIKTNFNLEQQCAQYVSLRDELALAQVGNRKLFNLINSIHGKQLASLFYLLLQNSILAINVKELKHCKM